jgi:lysophospholipase L1-like esterase
MKTVSLFLLLFIALNSIQPLKGQDKPKFWDDVQTILKYDKIYAPPANPILFTGSSSIRKWDDLERTFSSDVVMNRGIGGAVVNDITYYLNDVVFPYHPRQIVIYVGENNLTDKMTTADSILNMTKRLFRAIRTKLPDVPLIYISIKPSPVREMYMDKAKEANSLIRNFTKTEKNVVFVDVFSLMISPDGKPRPELFGNDMLHMNQNGYAIWRDAIRPFLVKR